MKKIIAILTALCLILTAAALAEGAEEKAYWEEHPGVLAFDSYWVSGDAQIRIEGNHTDGGYEMLVVEMTGENTFNSWEYLLTYDEETKNLVADKTGMKSANTFDKETGDITNSVYEYEDGSARFFINADGQLSWDDEKEDTFQATVFNRIGMFPGRYMYDRAQLKVNWAGEDLIYDVNLEWADSAFETWDWSLSGNYDPATDTLVLRGTKRMYTYKEDGELDLDADQHEEEVSAVFAIDDEGCIVIPESTDPGIMGYQYEPDHGIYGMWMWEF